MLTRSESREGKGERSGKRRGESNAYRKADCSFESAVRAAQGFAIKMLISAVLLLSVVASASAQFNLVATIPGHAQSAIVGDVDNDGNNELLVLNSSQKQVRIYDGSLDLKAVLNFSEAPISAVIADPDDDNKNELIVGTSDSDAGGYVYVGEVHEGKFKQEWKSPWIGSFRKSTELAVGDSDNDGKKEIAVGVSWYGRYLVVYEWTGSTYTQVFRDNIGSDVDSVAYGDVDGDGVEELLVGTACWSDYALRVYDNFSLTYRLHQGSTIVAAGDVDGDNKKEIVTGAGTYCGHATTPSPVIKVFEWIDGGYNVSWTSETLPHLAYLIYVCTGDLIGSPSEEIAMSTCYPGESTTMIGIYTKSTNSSYICIYWEEYPDEDTTHIEIGDYDNDGQNELIVTSNKVKIYEVEEGLHITITTDKTEYTTGDIILANITIANPTEETKHVLFNWWVTVPSKGFYTAPLATTPMTLPPSYNTTLTYTITVGYWGADNFSAVFCVALTNQTSGKIISSDATFWNYEARGAREAGEKSIESIVSEIKRSLHH